MLSVVFAGSYISCIVEDDRAQNIAASGQSENVTEGTRSSDITVTEVNEIDPSMNGKTSQSVTKATTVSKAKVTKASHVTTVTEATTVPETTVTTVPETPPPATEPPPPPPPAVPETQYDYSTAVPQSAAVGEEYLNDCAFIGDSHINGMGGYNIVGTDRVFAKNGISVSRASEFISVDSVKAINPKHIYIMFGTNGYSWENRAAMLQNYINFVNSLKQSVPDADIFIMSIPPVTAAKEAEGTFINSEINAYNNDLLQMANGNSWHFIDVNSSLKDESGYLASSTDGIHMTKDLYSVFKEYILTHTVS